MKLITLLLLKVKPKHAHSFVETHSAQKLSYLTIVVHC